jgi:tetratricopeptide (TPR) repeat protein
MTLAGTLVGQTVRVVARGGQYGYSRARRPAAVPEQWEALLFEVTLRRYEVERNLSDMGKEDMFEFCAHKQALGRQLFAEKKFATAVRVYEKALLVVQSGLGQEVGQSNVQGAKSRVRSADVQVALSTRDARRAREAALTHLLNSAVCKAKLEDWPGVVDYCSRALDIDRVSPKALFRRAVAYRWRDELESAKLDLDHIPSEHLHAQPSLQAQVKRERALIHNAEKDLLAAQAKAFKNMFADPVAPPMRLYMDMDGKGTPPTRTKQERSTGESTNLLVILQEVLVDTVTETFHGLRLCGQALAGLCGCSRKAKAE